MRNIGSSVGASVVTTILSRRQQFHIARLSEHITPTSPGLRMSLQAAASYAHRIGASNQQAQSIGLGMIYRSLMAQAAALSYLDAYITLGVAAATMFFLSFLLKSNDPKHTEVTTGH